jgi:aquaporin Z
VKDTENNSFYGLAIGFTLAVGAFAGGSVSGGAYNPAVALGASMLGMFTWSHLWIYLIAEIAGGAAAAGAFLLTQPAATPDRRVAEVAQRDGAGATPGRVSPTAR